jgi:transaldolase/glucose-6-phosphate isomerase
MSDAPPVAGKNPIKALADFGQSVWLDYIKRDLIVGGGLQRLVEQDGVTGLTSNPAIFEKAIATGSEYDDLLVPLAQKGLSAEAIYERLAVRDIQEVADVLRPVYDRTQHRDGFVSLEVSPRLAQQTETTVSEAIRLWEMVDRPNLMIKVPATPAGIPAIRALIAEGVNVNVTLLFSRIYYEQAVLAYLDGLEARVIRGQDVSRIASVASMFVSRIDTAVDKVLDDKAQFREKKFPADAVRLRQLKGKAAVANSRLAYRRYGELFSSERWRMLLTRGGWPQRLLWGSTGTKNPSYSDVIYVDELIGFETVNTLPPATLEAFRDHGRPRPSLTENVGDAEEVVRTLIAEGISLHEITDRLLVDGVRLFAEAYDKLLAAIAARAEQARAGRVS